MPTLGFVVDRYIEIRDFKPEDFWYIQLLILKPGLNPSKPVNFTWERTRLYEKEFVTACFNISKAQSDGLATIKKVKKEKKTKMKPLPLTTVKLQKIGTSKLRMSSHSIMSLAEKLYVKGFISYPRTETDQFDKTIDLKRLVGNLIDFPDQRARDFIQNMVEREGFEQPRKGNNNDHAHPPIHPVKLPQGLTPDEFKVYNLIARHFLACCSKDAVGEQTRVEAQVGEESFNASGIVVTEKNYLEIYEPFDFWGGVELPKFQEGEVLTPSDYSVRQGKTSPPELLTEADLIGMMEKNNIGTDSTIHEHIKTIQERKYAFKQGQVFKPSNLGVSLVECYNSLGIDLAKPRLRAEMEKDMDLIAKGNLTKTQVLEKYQSQMALIYKEVESKKSQFVDSLAKYISKNRNLDGERADPEEGVDDDDEDKPGDDDPGNEGMSRSVQPNAERSNRGGNTNQSIPRIQGKRIGPCTKCGEGNIIVRQTRAGGFFLSCSAYPKCQTSASLPQKVSNAEMTETKCSSCSKAYHDNIYKVKLTFEDKSIKTGNYCLLCSDKLTGYKYELKTKTGDAGTRSSNEGNNSVIQAEPRQPEKTGQQPTCYKCNQVGHYANNCTNPRQEDSTQHQFPQGPPVKKPTITCSNCGMTGHLTHQCRTIKDKPSQKKKEKVSNFTDIEERTVPAPSRTCYKCGKPGHYANACSEASSVAPKKFDNKGSSGENVCFKCQKPGHWARDCPNK
jgi:DNA topoisomerase-3